MKKPELQRQSLKMRERWAKRKKWKNVSSGEERAHAKLKMRQRTHGKKGERVKNGPTREISPPDLTVGLTACVRAKEGSEGREETAEKTIFSLFPPFKEFLSHHSLAGSESLAFPKRRGGVLVVHTARQSHLCLLAFIRLSSKFKPTTMIGRQREERRKCSGRLPRSSALYRLSVRRGPLVC